MYEEFFKLRQRPFVASPQPARYFPATVIENARQTLCRAIGRGEGPGLIVGAPGTGKTMLCLMLVEEFADQFGVVLLTGGRIGTRQALLQSILYELRLPCRGLDEGELRLSLLDCLEPKSVDDHGLLLIVDEAHTLSGRLLEELRLLTNVVRDGQPRVRVVLAGGSSLEERFSHPNLSSFAQRLAARCYLEPLDSAETTEYVRAQVQSAGGDPLRLFDQGAYRAIFRATDGVPRLINQVCDHALILASLGGLERVGADAIDEAWADLQQLPAPWASVPARPANDQIVEFGSLDDNPAETPSAIPFPAATERALARSAAERQLDVVAEHLGELQASYEIGGSGGTEVELDFPEFGDPFGEQFAEEEVVVERFRDEGPAFGKVPRVSSSEGLQLGTLLRDFESATSPAPRIASCSDVPSLVAVEIARPSESADAATAPGSAVAHNVLPETPPAVRVTAPAAFTPPQEQASLLVVVDDEAPQAAAPVAGGTVDRLEYRKLFTKLRRPQ